MENSHIAYLNHRAAESMNQARRAPRAAPPGGGPPGRMVGRLDSCLGRYVSWYHDLIETAASITSGFSSQLLLLISGPLLARMLGVIERGALAGLIIWPVLMIQLANCGMPMACSYFMNQRPEQAGTIIGQAYRAAFCQILVGTSLLMFLMHLWTKGQSLELRYSGYILTSYLPAYLIFQYALAILQGQQRFRELNALRVVPSVVYVASVGMLFAIGNHAILPVAVCTSCAWFPAAIVATVAAFRKVEPNWTKHPMLFREMLRFGLRGQLGAIAPVDALPLDQAAVALFLTKADLGLYVVACSFSNFPRITSMGVSMIAYPSIASCFDPSIARHNVWRFFWLNSIVNFVIMASLVAIMPYLIPLLFGAAFAEATPTARLLLIGTTIMGSRRVLGDCLRGMGQPQISSIAELSMYPWLLLGGWFLITHFGSSGLAVALLIGYTLSLLVAMALAVLLQG